MSLVDVVRELDKDVQRECTRIGRRIPERSLYMIITPQSFFLGNMGYAYFEKLHHMPVLSLFPLGFLTIIPDAMINLHGLTGGIFYNDILDEMIKLIEFLKKVNRKTRLPIFLAGAFYLGKSIYDIANYLLNGEPLDQNTSDSLYSGLGFLGLASSMYLKDQDPKLLERESVNQIVPAYQESGGK